MWKNSWWIAKRELKMQIPGIILTLLFTIFIGIIITPTFYLNIINLFEDAGIYGSRLVFEGHTVYIDSILIDAIFLGFTPCLSALFMWGPYVSLRAIKEDPFGKRLAVYRSLPVSTEVLTLSRILFMLVIFVLFSAAFYLTITISVPNSIFIHLEYHQFLAFVLFWIGYALVIGSLNPYIESGTNGKVLYIYSFIMMVCLILVLFLVHQVWNTSIVNTTILLLTRAPVIPVIVSLTCGILGVITMAKLLNKRLSERDYL
ncbi:hypothetical protein [Gracilibacillus lacisalsi]|uniref:hypothetical protein n=1 Tax=Gracilibacillus lacisalsi TaxID=393087 RepID=UPI00035CA1EC|nr:hypothetical protein [Gracilibacillus lacisalsi]